MAMPGAPVLLCLSHLRWDFVFQRPQHLMTRAAATYNVIFFEEPVEAANGEEGIRSRSTPEGILIATPYLRSDADASTTDAKIRGFLDGLLRELGQPAVTWFYTPMALAFAGHLRPRVVVYDVMDELSAFRGASLRLTLLERRLLKLADVVFTGGPSLHEAKRTLHSYAYLFPSSVDSARFAAARLKEHSDSEDPHEGLGHPRIGFFGVIDERMDLDLVQGIAERRPEWNIVMVGPVVKIDPSTLPSCPNLHWLGARPYTDLPSILATWDAGFMPFALNEATRFISPTKTPEFLAAGVPLVSTAVPDVVSDWGKDGSVEIAAGPDGMVAAIEMLMRRDQTAWLVHVDHRLSGRSWSVTWSRMRRIVDHFAGSARGHETVAEAGI